MKDTELYYYRKKAGLCCYCGEIAVPGTTRCIRCSQIHQIKKRERYERLKENGICVNCESRKAVKGVRCPICSEKAKRNQIEYRKVHPRREYRRKEA